MENIEDLLSREITEENYLVVFKEIADCLIHDNCIVCGKRTFRLAELEFYYYDKRCLNNEWNRKTYPRTKKEAGKLFFHYSGVDICFPSDFSNGRFGGILIRSLYDESTKQYICGPLLCANEMLNACAETGEWLQIKTSNNRKCNILQTSRYGIKYENKGFTDTLCFYDDGVAKAETPKCETWDFKKEKEKYNSRNYRKRFC